MPGRLRTTLTVLAATVGAYAVASRAGKRLLGRRHTVGDAVIDRLHDDTRVDAGTGAVRSIQSGEVVVAADELEKLWTPESLERLARTYWRFLTRVSLGLIRVEYTATERYVVLLRRPLTLLTFRAPEYEMDGERGIVRWRIEKGVLVARRGHGGDGYLEIDVRRLPAGRPGRARMHVEVEVANFYPAIASTFSQWFYAATQSRIHVLITYAFLRSLARLDLAESRVGRLAGIEELPTPQAPPPTQRALQRAPAR
ncbi:MAG TPA: hypothetical protein VLB47_14075 [Solirubrobacteraceae bacterium]|nr:hypothetical protein [Solirubrobacteraceae bacterium]